MSDSVEPEHAPTDSGSLELSALREVVSVSDSLAGPDAVTTDASLENRLLREAIKARLFPGLAGAAPGSQSGALELPRVGRFAILRKLGAGAMGVVFAGYDEELDRKVAIKLLRTAGDPGHGRARLLREAQALARLSHPNVVQVHEIGEHGGQVFVAMEFVSGTTLRQHLSAKQLSWQEVLKLMIQAGRGLEAAHRAGLVHRDFKPDNIMVATEGRARVLDFGLVRMADDNLDELDDPTPLAGTAVEPPSSDGTQVAETASLTRTGSVLGTPNYMALEQHLGRATDPLGDQYSFCVTTWEALYGQRPFAPGTLAQLFEAVRDFKLRPPPRETKVPRRVREILTRGLRPERERRWPNMGELLAALEHELRPRRRGPWLILAAGLTAAAAAGLVASQADFGAGGRTRCQASAELLAGTWDEPARSRVRAGFAATQLPYAAQAVELVTASFDDWAERWLAERRRSCEASLVHGLQSQRAMDQRSACLDEQRRRVAGLVSVLIEADEDVVANLDDLLVRVPEPDSCARESVLDDPKPPRDPVAVQRLAQAQQASARAQALLEAGKGEAAVELAEQVVATLADGSAAATAADERLAIEARAVIAQRSFALGRRSEGIAQLRELAGRAEILGDAELVAQLRVTMASLGAGRLDREELERWLLADAELAVAKIGEHSDRWQHLLTLSHAAIERRAGNYEAARNSYEQLAIDLGGSGEGEHGGLWAEVQNELAHVAIALFDVDRARGHYAAARQAVVARWGERHPRVADVDYARAMLAFETNGLDEATQLVASAERVYLANHGRESQRIAAVRTLQSQLELMAGRFDEAQALLEEALGIYGRLLGDKHFETAKAREALGAVHFYRGDFEAALAAYNRSRVGVVAYYGPDHEDVANLDINIAGVLIELGRYGEAETGYTSALQLLERSQLADPDLFAAAYGGRGQARLRLDMPTAARGDLERALGYLDADGTLVQHRALFGFALAKLLTGSSAERKRGRELAEAARVTFGEFGMVEDLERVEAWLARAPG